MATRAKKTSAKRLTRPPHKTGTRSLPTPPVVLPVPSETQPIPDTQPVLVTPAVTVSSSEPVSPPTPVAPTTAVSPSPDATSSEVHELASLPTEAQTPASTSSPTPPFPALSPISGSKKRFPWVILIILLVLGVVILGWAIYRASSKPTTVGSSISTQSTQTTTSTPSVTPATPTPVLDREDLKIQVLNGSGTPGAAGVAQKKLEEAGYVDVAAGNATSYEFDSVEISLKSDKLAFFDLLASDLGPAYTIASQAGSLSKTSEYDAVITIGQL